MKKFNLEELGKKGIIAIASSGIVLSLGLGYIIAPNCSEKHEEDIIKKDKIIETLKTENKSKEEVMESDSDKIATLQKQVKDAEPWFKMNEEEQRKIAEENQRIADEKKAKEEEQQRIKEQEEKVAKENAEKNKFETGITYSQLARNPQDFKGKKCKFEGKVIQTLEDKGVSQIRFAVNGDYDNVILATYQTSLVSSRILEDDYITIYGTSLGVLTYTSTLGQKITVPSMLIEKINQ